MSNLYPAANAYPVAARRQFVRIDTGASAAIWTLSGIALAACSSKKKSSPARLPDSSFTTETPTGMLPVHPDSGDNQAYQAGVDQALELGGIRFFAISQNNGAPIDYRGYSISIVKATTGTAGVSVNGNVITLSFGADFLPTVVTQQQVIDAWNDDTDVNTDFRAVISEAVSTPANAWLGQITAANSILPDEMDSVFTALNNTAAGTMATIGMGAISTKGGATPALTAPTAQMITETANSATETNNEISGRLSATDSDSNMIFYGIMGHQNAAFVVKHGIYGTLRLNSSTGDWIYRLGVTQEQRDLLNSNLLDMGDMQTETFTVLAGDYSTTDTEMLRITVRGANEPAGATTSPTTTTQIPTDMQIDATGSNSDDGTATAGMRTDATNDNRYFEITQGGMISISPAANDMVSIGIASDTMFSLNGGNAVSVAAGGVSLAEGSGATRLIATHDTSGATPTINLTTATESTALTADQYLLGTLNIRANAAVSTFTANQTLQDPQVAFVDEAFVDDSGFVADEGSAPDII